MSKLISLSRAGRLWRKKPQEKLKQMDCLLLGHSHTVAVRLALEEDERLAWLDICTIAREKLQPEVQMKKNGYELHPGIKSRICGKAYQNLALSIGGGPHVIIGLPQSLEPFDFILPSEPDLPLLKNARILSYDSVVEVFRSRNKNNRNTIEAIAACFEGTIFHLDYPPPVPDSWALLHPLKFSGVLGKYGVSPLSLRYKLWRVNLETITEILSEFSIQRLKVPADMLADDGAISQKALYRDPVHGSASYGRAVAQQLKAALRM